MNLLLQENLINYHSLKILSYAEEGPKIKKRWLKKLRRKIVSYFDTELDFCELYKILKSTEKEGWGFFIKPLKCERLSSSNEKIVFQQVEVGMRYIGGSSWTGIKDVGFEEIVEKNDTKLKTPKQIKPTDIICISNVQILHAIKDINKKVYDYIFNCIVEYLYEKINCSDAWLSECMIEVLENYGVQKTYYSMDGFCDDSVCIEKEKNEWIVYTGERGNKHNVENYVHYIQACYSLLYRLSESDEMYFELKKQLIHILKDC